MEKKKVYTLSLSKSHTHCEEEKKERRIYINVWQAIMPTNAREISFSYSAFFCSGDIKTLSPDLSLSSLCCTESNPTSLITPPA